MKSLRQSIGFTVLASSLVLAGASALTAQSVQQDRDQALAEWRRLHGTAWDVVIDPETEHVRFLFGGARVPVFRPRQDEDFVTLARQAVLDTHALHGVDDTTLGAAAVSFLPLGLYGSNDKLSVRFEQHVHGVPVEHGAVNVLYDLEGRMLSIDVTGLPRLASLATRPALDAARARRVAEAEFTAEHRLAPTRVDAPVLEIAQISTQGFRRPFLVWRAGFYHQSPSAVAGRAYLVDAGTGAILRRDELIHRCDVSGVVRSMATPGTRPDTAANPETDQAMPHLQVDIGLGPVHVNTDENGNFNFVAALPPLGTRVRYLGLWCDVVNLETSDYSRTQSLNSTSGNVINMNGSSDWWTTAEANAFLWVNNLKDWTVNVNATDTTANFQAIARVNQPGIDENGDGTLDFCNAWYGGGAVTFYRDGGGCPNAAYSSIVLHEMGHWLNDRYGSGNGPDGFGEGAADVYAMYVLDDPVIGRDFNGTNVSVRTGLNTTTFCGDSNPACYGEVHGDGEVLMGALWKVRARLKTSLGTTTGGAVANGLFNAWMNAYDDDQIKTVIAWHWLTLDDNDGNLTNGTPHQAEITGGFDDQGFQTLVVYVDVTNGFGPWTGTQLNPYFYPSDALPYVPPGGTLSIAANTYTEHAIEIRQNVTLRATGGTVIVR